jgi:cell division septation protein DedD
MKKSKIILALGIICLLMPSAFAASATDSLYSQARKLYSQGNFEAAAKIYESLCPQLGAKEKRICQFNEVKSLTESRKINLARLAEPKLLFLIAQTEPNDSLYAEFSAEDSKLQIMLDQPVRAVRSWKSAQASANTDFFPELFVLCRDIVSAYPASGLTAENCNNVKPADTSLISLQRAKVAPLSKAAIAPSSSSKPSASSSQPPAISSQSSAPNPPPAASLKPPTPSPQPQWYVQLGAFGNRGNAEKLVADFKNRDVQLYIIELTDRNLFTVRTGYFNNAEDARVFAEQKIAPVHTDYKIFSGN